jgi:threonine dehydrogenase-like Zn-dependent dehydrogenase
MQALRLDAVGQLSIAEVAKPVPGPDELLVRIEACGICGTDRHLFLGEFPAAPPVTLGHEFSGIVEAVGVATQGFAIGMRVTCDPNISCGRCSQCRRGRVNLCEKLQAIGIHRDGGFAEYAILPVSQAFELPLSLDPLHGAFCEPLACCLHGVDLAEIKTGASVVVLGGGVIGLLVVQLVRLAGATRVVLVTRHPEKRRLAESLGATATLDPGDGDPVAAVVAADGLLPGGADVVIECAGVAETTRQSTRLARCGGTVVILGVMPQGEMIEIEPFDIVFRELRLLGSFVNPFTHRRAAELIASGNILVAPLISRIIGFDAAVDAISGKARPGEVKVVVVPNKPGRVMSDGDRREI